MISEFFQSFDEALPDLNCFFVSASRHDRDRIEVHCGFDGLVQAQNNSFCYDVDFVLFVPKTLGLLEADDASTLRQEFQSYVRLHTHVTDPKSETSVLRVQDRLQTLKDHLTTDSLRVFAIEFEGFLKAQSKKTRKQILALAAESPAINFVDADIEASHKIVDDYRSVLVARQLFGKQSDEVDLKRIDHDLILLNEYVSHLYVQYLGALNFAVRAQPAAASLAKRIATYASQEAQLRLDFKLLIDISEKVEPGLEEELYLRRISILKKYFQKSLFVEVVGESLQKRMLIPVYGVSAALAASFAILVQLYQARSMAERVGINSIALITVGVLAYVAKDIMKDFFRRFFLQTSSRWFPDYEKKLYIEREAKKQRLGEIQEYVRSFDSDKLPGDLRLARYSNTGGEMEEFLHEDVLHFKKRVSLNLSMLDAKKEFPWGLREVVRYRFDRLRTSMEDPFKTMYVLSEDGETTTRQGHRLYNIHLGIWVQKVRGLRRRPEGRPEFKAYRVSLDKTGVLGCDQLHWDRKTSGTPSIPD